MKQSVLTPTPAALRMGLLSLNCVLMAGAAQAQAPYLTAVTPPRNATAVATAASVSLTFAEPINATTAAGIRLHSAVAGGAKQAAFTTNGTTVVANPLVDFLPGETVSVTVPATLRSVAGVAAPAHVYQFTTAVGGTGSGIFAPVASIPDVAMSNGGSSIALGDLDGDGDLDVVSSNYDNQGIAQPSVNVRLNSGLNTGTFVPAASTPAIGALPGNVALGDVDGDGDLDLLAISNAGSNNNALVNVRLNNGTGTFTVPATNANPAVTPHTWFLTTGDIDGDGDLDILTAGHLAGNPAQGLVSILLNQGLNSGNFVPPAVNPTVNPGPYSIGRLVLGDVDSDGDLDMVIGSNTTAIVRLNDGTGNFVAPSANATLTVTGGGGIVGLAMGDIDGDGDLDLLAANATVGSNGRATGVVNVRINSGLNSGNFVVPANNAEVFVDNVPRNVVLGDVDGDGDLDFVTSNEGYSPIATTISVRLNNGTGTFTAPATNADPTVGGSPRHVALGDVDGDGDLDAVTINTVVNGPQATYQSNLSVRLNEPAVLYITTVSPASGSVGSRVTLTGSNFAGATGVSFNGTMAPAGSFTVTSATTIQATVPVGATNGPVYVTTPRGTMTTAAPFVVSGLLGTTAGHVEAAVSLYPNPAHSLLTVDVPAVAGAAQVQATLLNALGQVVVRQATALPATGAQLAMPVTGLDQGLYLLHLQAGSVVITKRVVVE